MIIDSDNEHLIRAYIVLQLTGKYHFILLNSVVYFHILLTTVFDRGRDLERVYGRAH